MALVVIGRPTPAAWPWWRCARPGRVVLALVAIDGPGHANGPRSEETRAVLSRVPSWSRHPGRPGGIAPGYMPTSQQPRLATRELSPPNGYAGDLGWLGTRPGSSMSLGCTAHHSDRADIREPV